MIGSSDRRREGFGRAGALRGWLTVLAAIFGALVAGHAFAQPAFAPAANAIEQVTVTRGASGRTAPENM